MSLPGGVDVEGKPYTDDPTELLGGMYSCKGEIAKARLYTASEMLAHFSDCQPTKALLRDLEELRASAVSEDKDIVEQKTQKKVKKPYWRVF